MNQQHIDTAIGLLRKYGQEPLAVAVEELRKDHAELEESRNELAVMVGIRRAS